MDDSRMGGNLAVRRILERYIDATYRADVDELRRLFHPDATMTGYLGSDLVIADPEPFLKDLEARPSMAESGDPYRAEIVRIESSVRTACGTIVESGFFGDGSFMNYFSLLQVEEKWTIVNKTFESR